MFRVICPHCEKENEFADESHAASECWACAESLVAGLTLVCQKTGKKIEIPNLPKSFLGRQNIGGEIFGRIISNGKAVISRRHCSIEFSDGKFYLQDEGSTNGTFYGENKIDCRLAPQRVEHNKLIFFGREPFVAKLAFKRLEKEQAAAATAAEASAPPEEIRIVQKYRCRVCAEESPTFSEDCQFCSTNNSLVAIYG